MAKSELKKGMLVMIYEDPITKKKPEGQARLLRQVNPWRWKVKFATDGFVCERFI